MARYTDYSTAGAPPGGVFLHDDEGGKQLMPTSSPSVYLEQARIDADKARLERDAAKLALNDGGTEVATRSDAGMSLGAPVPLAGQTSSGPMPVRASESVGMSRAPDIDAGISREAEPVASPGAPMPRSSEANMSAAPPGWEETRTDPQRPGAPASIDPRRVAFAGPGVPDAGGGAQGDSALVDASRRLTLAALQQGGGPSRRVAARTDEIGSVATTGGKIDPAVIGNAEANTRLSAARAVDLAQVQADTDYAAGEKQRAATDAIDQDAGLRRLERQASMRELHDQQLALAKDIGNAEPDQARFWGSKSTGAQVAAGLFLALGAIGSAAQSAATGRAVPNEALAAFNRAIDTDLAAQKEAIANKKTKLSTLGEAYQRFRAEGLDDEHATEASKAVAMQRIATEAVQKAGASGGDLARERAASLLQKADDDNARMRLSLEAEAAKQASKQTHYKTTPEHMVGGGGLSLVQKLHLLREQQNFEDAHGKSGAETSKLTGEAAKLVGGADGQHVTDLDGQRYALPNIDAPEAKEVRSNIAKRSEVQSGLRQMQKIIADTPTGSVIDHSALASVRTKMIAGINSMSGAGAPSHEEKEEWMGAIGGFRGAAGLTALDKNISDGTKAILSTYDAKPLPKAR